MKLIREAELLKNYIPVSRTTLWRMQKEGQFPAPLKLRGVNVWKEEDIRLWVNSQNEHIA